MAPLMISSLAVRQLCGTSGCSVYGRNIVVRNSVMAVCWYLVTNQCPPALDDMMAAWEKETWAFVERPRGATRLLLSACDFLAVLDADVPAFWQNVFVTWGMFDVPLWRLGCACA
mmetsp:Transcript_81488/g.162102  ORF Transcript_81488/g.162102 Transcript_81488/m.162102 type:complete len:115 (-) Transcript_81488:176-520(-)